jgi:carbon-monoxide dehydrogenase small subunit
LSRLALILNGEHSDSEVDQRRTLLEALRDSFRLTGTKEGCGNGNCGACTVLLDGKPVLSCLVLAHETEGRAVTTVEGIGVPTGDPTAPFGLNAVQEEMVQRGGVQCGFCTPGFIISATALLERDPDPDAATIRRALAGNLCRCTGYVQVVEAVRAAAARMQAGGGPG